MNAHRRQAHLARKLLTREEQAALSQRRPDIVYADLLLIYTVLSAAFVLLAAAPTLSVKICAFLLIGTRQYALFIMGHDGIHRNLHPTRRVNDRITRWLIFAPLGMTLEGGRASHLNHHRLLGSRDDPDRYLHGAENKATAARFLLFLTGLATFAKTVWKVTPFARPAQPGAGESAPGATRLRTFFISRFPVAVVQLLIVGGLHLSPISLWHYPLFWILPIYALVFVPDEIRAFCDHAHPIVPDAAVDEKRLITYAPPMWERLIFAPRNMNYHAEHHLWPFIPYYHLPQAHRLINARADDHIILRRSYVTFLWRYLRSLPLRTAGKMDAAPNDWKRAAQPLGTPA